MIVNTRAEHGAHPRVCGENSIEETTGALAAGSPPRVRGKPFSFVRIARGRGLTPACAGKTSRRYWRARPPAAHPRVCGENGWHRRNIAPNPGSPPRVRGKRRARSVRRARVRLTPACAGKTASTCSPKREITAHPRVCGENVIQVVCFVWAGGSPPRVRGKLQQLLHRINALGLTPACAGKTSRTLGLGRASRAHPRVCGENVHPLTPRVNPGGSPPRVRGKPPPRRGSRPAERLTPACAGKTARPGQELPPALAHPRVCGENKLRGTRAPRL